jgi:hypothetical protein
MDFWQPIDSAPKDGTRILLFRPTAFCALHIVIGSWNADSRHDHPKAYWSHDAEHELGTKEARKFQPTHWMPLPAYPDVALDVTPQFGQKEHWPALARVENHRFRHR